MGLRYILSVHILLCEKPNQIYLSDTHVHGNILGEKFLKRFPAFQCTMTLHCIFVFQPQRVVFVLFRIAFLVTEKSKEEETKKKARKRYQSPPTQSLFARSSSNSKIGSCASTRYVYIERWPICYFFSFV